MKLRKVLAAALALVMVVAAPVATTASETDLEAGLIGYYTFDDTLANGATEDGAATLNKGTAAYSDTAVSGKSFDFSANAGTSTLGNAAVAINLDKIPTTTAFTVNLWVYSTDGAAGTYVFFDGCCQYYQFRSNGAGAFPAARACMDDNYVWDSEIDHWRTGKETQETNKWQMVTYTVTATGKATVYVDGVEVSTYWDETGYTEDAWFAYTTDEGATYKNMFSDDNNAGAWTDLGILGSGDWWSENYAGLMDNVCIYERALTSADVAALYANDGVPENPEPTPNPGEGVEGMGDFDMVLPLVLVLMGGAVVIMASKKRFA